MFQVQVIALAVVIIVIGIVVVVVVAEVVVVVVVAFMRQYKRLPKLLAARKFCQIKWQ